jgi:glycosyltransferase involved in cell wall biosynthesis
MGKVSIALCTYNGAAYLQEQLESFAGQLRLPDELVVGDDGSSDQSVSILENFAKTAPFPLHIHVNDKNLGLIRNFDETIKRCSGDIIFLSDQDDVWMTEKIARILPEFERLPNVGLVFSDVLLVDQNLNSLGSTLFQTMFSQSNMELARKGKMLDVLLERNVAGGMALAFRADLVPWFSPIPTKFAKILHDYWIALIAAAISEVHFVDEILVKYRQHPGQQTMILWNDVPTENEPNLNARFENTIHDLRARRSELVYLQNHVNDLGERVANDRLAGSLNKIKEAIANIDSAIHHLDARSFVESSYAKRVLVIGKELVSGRYHKHSNGLASAIKDLYGNS